MSNSKEDSLSSKAREVIVTLFDPKTTDEERLEKLVAGHQETLMKCLGSYKRPRPPRRPGNFDELDDSELLSKVRAILKIEKPSDEDRQFLALFGGWRGRVMRFEAECEARLLCVLRAASHFQAAGDEGTFTT